MNRNQLFDRLMALHRRAYECETFSDWTELAVMLGARDGDLAQIRDAIDAIWHTAQAAKSAGMDKRLAFPFVGDLTCPKCGQPKRKIELEMR